MMSKKSQASEVTIRVAVDGTLTPLSFTWRGRGLRVAGVGRSWSDAEGDHWLVMAAIPERVFELLRTPEGLWWVLGNRQPPAIA